MYYYTYLSLYTLYITDSRSDEQITKVKAISSRTSSARLSGEMGDGRGLVPPMFLLHIRVWNCCFRQLCLYTYSYIRMKYVFYLHMIKTSSTFFSLYSQMMNIWGDGQVPYNAGNNAGFFNIALEHSKVGCSS